MHCLKLHRTCLIHVAYCIICIFKLSNVFVVASINGFKCQGDTLCSVRNIVHFHGSLNDVPSNIIIARLSPVSDHMHTCRMPMRMYNGTRPSMFTISQFTILDCSDLIDLMDSFHAGSRKFLLVTFWPARVSRKLTTDTGASGIPLFEI